MKLRHNAAASLAACLLISTMTGCSVFGDDKSSDRDRPDRGDRIPGAARVVEEGRGELSYTATEDGTVYVQDAKTKETIVSRRVDRGDRVRVQFDEDRVRVDDETVYDGNLERDNGHRIYFVREDDRSSSDRRRDR